MTEIVTPLARENTYNLRNTNDFNIPNFRLQITSKSFFPSTINEWNNISPEIRHNPSHTQFKYILKRNRNTHSVPPHFFIGERKLNIIVTRLRNSCSTLNYDLFRVNLKDDPSCSCGYHTENVNHFLFDCSLYNDLRQLLFNRLNLYHPLTLEKLLFGDDNLSTSDNSIITLEVQKYVKKSKRF